METYSQNCLGYDMSFFKAHPDISGGAQGGVCLVAREWLDGWGNESMRFHRPNVVSYGIVTRPTWTLLVGAYLLPLTLEHLS